MSDNHKDLYKRSVDLGEQQKLRQLQLLDEQKLRRQLQQDAARHVQDSEEEGEEEEAPTHSRAQHRQRKKKQQNNNNAAKRGQQHFKLQQSEWLRQRPENLSDWLLLPCPVGRRCMVIATHGRTKVHNKAGRIIMQLRTMLPGDAVMQKCKTVLDCVYVQETDTFYVLDALTFGQQQLQDCDANFRFFWLRSRFDEQGGELAQRGKRNEKPFKLLDYYDFEDANVVHEMLQRYPLWEANQPKLDGLLFYHKEASYTCGSTPLVCWLFAFMLPDVLQLPVNSSYVAPEDYQPSAALAYMDAFDQQLLQQRQQQKQRGKAAKEEAATVSTAAAMEQEQEQHDELDEYAELRSLLEHQRRLELGELDMDCTPPSSAAPAVATTSAASTAVGSSC
ncbi:snurportin-1 [Drosophila albomicans]|uniref:Snurportin-1 n=1 Tax=Drosophila albomicans TaxID=7291 RepID=A0A6P8WMS7_DROAB|nr:snurportin-1 [Drosophila albomicans]